MVRFEKFVNARSTDECWPWTGPLDKEGYGIISGDEPRQLRAHRIAYERKHGPIPPGKNVCHRCDNPQCVNVDHLFLGTTDDNNKDKARKLRASSKLTVNDVREIRKMLAAGHTQSSVAKRFGVASVWHIKHNKFWRHLKD